MKRIKHTKTMQIILFVWLWVSYFLCRYVAFDIHGMKSFPKNLAILGTIFCILSFLSKSKLNFTYIFTCLGYGITFILGVIFQTDGYDPGGGRTNSLWKIWFLSYAGLILLGMLTDFYCRMRTKSK